MGRAVWSRYGQSGAHLNLAIRLGKAGWLLSGVARAFWLSWERLRDICQFEAFRSCHFVNSRPTTTSRSRSGLNSTRRNLPVALRDPVVGPHGLKRTSHNPGHPPYKVPYQNFQLKIGPLGGPRPMQGGSGFLRYTSSAKPRGGKSCWKA